MSTEFPQKTGYHRYEAYLLHLWQDRPGSPVHASLQDAKSDERHNFANIEQLLAFLATQNEMIAGQIECRRG